MDRRRLGNNVQAIIGMNIEKVNGDPGIYKTALIIPNDKSHKKAAL